ncbi:dynamin-related protein 3B-like isoform X1 [Tripterygium wilfordii]|uniref:dynamin-related protein 3B-like isoform X1 n=1 Tax=Tripterygium wilfordii TaxID=458696 RepID=UPI0018F855BA|nr:dynamin-related protein 3B-like isoform X1 [Tripterygium wilfordii]
MSQGANSEASMTIGSSVIPILNKLHDIVAPVGAELAKISLPHVAVVGSQSSGKSSVLEALVGRDFLPRGCDICTRRPLSLMLEQRSVAPGDDHREWGEFRHLPGKRFYDFLKIRQEIQAETEREVGFNKGVSDKQIRLKIYSPNVLNMTLIDLPGITKVPVGDQPSDIEARIRKMIMEHIIQKNCIILAVTPANSDLATSDALQIAREADPTGSRTIGVITKLDIMDRGTNACNFLLGRVIPLRLGYVGVVNRSQEDINENRSIKEALAHEERFFCDHHVYNGLRDCCGIPQLAKKLNQILEQHIQRELPSLRAELNSRKIIVAEELQIYGEVVESKAEQGAILLSILTQYCADFIAILDGKNEMMSSKELFGGARILYIFQTVFVRSLEEVDPCADISDEDIQTAIRNASGLRGALFVPEVPFEVLVRRQIARLLDPSLQCLRFVYDEMLKIARACRVTELHRFPLLRRCLDEVAGKFLRDGVIPAERMIGNLIEMEMDYINSSHPNFLGGKKAVDLAHQMMRSIQDGVDVERLTTAEKGQKSQLLLPKSVATGASTNQGNCNQSSNERSSATGGNFSSRTWGCPINKPSNETSHNVEQISSTIQLREDGVDVERLTTAEKSQKSQPLLPESVATGASTNQGNCNQSSNERSSATGGNFSSRIWGIPSKFWNRASSGPGGCPINKPSNETSHNVEQISSTIQLREDGVDVERLTTAKKGQKSQPLLPKSVATGDSTNQGNCNQSSNERSSATGIWGISSIFGNRASSGPGGCPINKSSNETSHNVEQISSTIQLREPPSILKPLEGTEEETVEVIVTKLLLQSYYDIVRKNIQDLVPKAIMHFLVNYTKKDLHNTCIQKLYRENLLDELLQEQEDVFVKRKHARDMFNVLQQAVQTLDEVESEMQSKSTISSMGAETTTGLPKVSGFSGH